MPRRFRLLAFFAASLIGSWSGARFAHSGEAQVVIHCDQDGGVISRHLYGHFAEHLGRCIYDGLWVGEDSPIPNTRGVRNDVIDALKRIKIPNLRWPGGCFADDYHWRDGVGPRDQRPRTVNLHWGQVTDSNAFGTHEFLDLCELIGADAYIAGNVGSGTPEELRDWVEYMTHDGDAEMANLRRANGRDEPWKVPFLGVGNENWGCGGNMRAEYYADLFRRYATFCVDMGGNRLTRVACGPGGRDPHWTRTVMARAGGRMDALSVHFYTVKPNWQHKYSATGFDEQQWFDILAECLTIDDALKESEREMDKADPRQRVAMFVDEWGAWYAPEPGTPGHALYQQNSLRDAVLAGLTLHIFHDHNERVRMANIAQVVNVLQAMILTEGEQIILTPTYHVFEMYAVHHDATRLPTEIASADYRYGDRSMPAVSVSASRDAAGTIHVSLVNAHATEPMSVACQLEGVPASGATGRVLTADALDAHNSFDNPRAVQPRDFTAMTLSGERLKVELPPRSIVVLSLHNE